jgi:hypothetical protein
VKCLPNFSFSDGQTETAFDCVDGDWQAQDLEDCKREGNKAKVLPELEVA